MTVRSGSDESPRETSAAKIALAIAVIVVAALAAYHNSFAGAFVLDDQSSIETNASIRQLWPPGPALTPPSDSGTGGRPLANYTYALDYAISGLRVQGYHASNVTILVLAALTLFGVVRRTLRQPLLREFFGGSGWLVALAAAGLWTLHPLTSSTVDYMAQRTELLAALFCLLTLYFFIRSTEQRESRIWPVLAVGACLLGMASKETMVTTPVLVWLYDRTFVAGSFRAAWRQRGRLHLALAATWLALAAFMASARLSARGIGFDLGVPWFNYTLTQCHAVLLYLKLAFWPHPLVFDYGWKFERAIAPALPAALLLIAILCGVVWMIRRKPTLGFLGAWFFVLLAPSSSVVPLTEQPIAESRVFLPLTAITMLVAIGLFLWAGRRGLLACLPLALVLGVATVRRHDDYRSALALWSDTVAKVPDNARAHNNLGSALTREPGRESEAAAQFVEALRLRPDYADAHNNLGAEWQRAGRTADAIAQFEAALRLNPGFADAHYNLGTALAAAGRPADAIPHFEAALRLNPENARAHNNLGAVLLDLGRVDDAFALDNAAIRLDPNFPDAHYNLGNALARANRTADAIEEFTTALRLQPEFAKAHNNLGTLLLQAGRVPDAITHFEAAVRIAPEYALARSNLARAKQLQGDAARP